MAKPVARPRASWVHRAAQGPAEVAADTVYTSEVFAFGLSTSMRHDELSGAPELQGDMQSQDDREEALLKTNSAVFNVFIFMQASAPCAGALHSEHACGLQQPLPDMPASALVANA